MCSGLLFGLLLDPCHDHPFWERAGNHHVMDQPEPNKRLARDFFARSCAEVCRDILGCTLVRILDGKKLRATIVEVEAYTGPEDDASHAWQGKKTEANKSMYLAPGFSYVYQRKGHIHCFNITTDEEGHPGALLIRSVAPLSNIDVFNENRMADRKNPINKVNMLCAGPGKMCKCLKISLEHDGLDLLTNNEIWVEPAAEPLAPGDVIADRRVRIDYAGWRAANAPLRFTIKGHSAVSVPVVSRPATVQNIPNEFRLPDDGKTKKTEEEKPQPDPVTTVK